MGEAEQNKPVETSENSGSKSLFLGYVAIAVVLVAILCIQVFRFVLVATREYETPIVELARAKAIAEQQQFPVGNEAGIRILGLQTKGSLQDLTARILTCTDQLALIPHVHFAADDVQAQGSPHASARVVIRDARVHRHVKPRLHLIAIRRHQVDPAALCAPLSDHFTGEVNHPMKGRGSLLTEDEATEVDLLLRRQDARLHGEVPCGHPVHTEELEVKLLSVKGAEAGVYRAARCIK